MLTTETRIESAPRSSRACAARGGTERGRGFTLLELPFGSLRTTHHRKRSAFSLLELLVVIAIIGLIVSFLVPVLTRMQASRMRVDCAAHLHELGLAAASYAIDHDRALPRHFGDGAVPFDTFLMRRDDGEYVNLGLLIDYVKSPELFYCTSQTRSTSPSIAFDTPQNKWRPGQGGAGGSGPAGLVSSLGSWSVWGALARTGWLALGAGGGNSTNPGGPPAGVNSSYPARSRGYQEQTRPRWSMFNHSNKVIYSDFIGVDDWPGKGRFRERIRAPHDSEGYNRLFGNGSVTWADAEPIEALRPVDDLAPTAQELYEYYKLLDVLP